MSLDPVKLPSADSELSRLIDLMCDGVITPNERDRLESLLENDRDAKLYCVAYLDLHAQVQWLTRDEAKEERGTRNEELPVVIANAPFVPYSSFLIPHSDFLGGVLFSYMAAAMILGVGILVAWAWKLPDYQQVAQQSTSVPSPLSPLLSVVGRITGMVDCRWSVVSGQWSESTSHQPRATGHLIHLGDKYALASGLMEITYNTGAKVILQGPVTYEVDSPASGSLSLGKLTARVEKNEEGRTKNEELPDSHSSFLIPHSYFTVKTPTATVTDLGTEFGVEVGAQGECHVQTFVGLVDVVPSAAGKSMESRHVRAGEMVQIDASGMIAKAPVQPTRFIRTMRSEKRSPYAEAVLDDRPLTYWPLNDKPGVRYVSDCSGNHCEGRVVGTVHLAQRGPFQSDDSLAAEFSGKGYIEANQLPNSDPAHGFSIEVWASADGGNGQRMNRSVVTYRDDINNREQAGFMIYATDEDRWSYTTGGGAGRHWATIFGTPVIPGQWTYIVGTFEPNGPANNGVLTGIGNFYVNGQLVASHVQKYLPNVAMPVRVGAGTTELPTADIFFLGRIAEVAVYDRPLAPTRVHAHWEAGRHINTVTDLPRKEVPSTRQK